MLLKNSESEIISRHFAFIIKYLFKVIRGHRPTNLKDYRIKSGNDKEKIKGLDVVRQYAVLFERRVQSSTRARKAQVETRQTNPTGRSMIEMLGVLAIIGVLSVGGIAGYSKAMEKVKTNRTISEYANILFGLQNYIDNIKKLPSRQGYAHIAKSLDLIPPSWDSWGEGNNFFKDTLGNSIQMQGGNGSFMFEIYFGGGTYYSNKQKLQFCRELYQNLVLPLQGQLLYAYIWRSKASAQSTIWYGSNYCAEDRNCLRNITMSEIEQQCRSCGYDNENGGCSLVMDF